MCNVCVSWLGRGSSLELLAEVCVPSKRRDYHFRRMQGSELDLSGRRTWSSCDTQFVSSDTPGPCDSCKCLHYCILLLFTVIYTPYSIQYHRVPAPASRFSFPQFWNPWRFSSWTIRHCNASSNSPHQSYKRPRIITQHRAEVPTAERSSMTPDVGFCLADIQHVGNSIAFTGGRDRVCCIVMYLLHARSSELTAYRFGEKGCLGHQWEQNIYHTSEYCFSVIVRQTAKASTCCPTLVYTISVSQALYM